MPEEVCRERKGCSSWELSVGLYLVFWRASSEVIVNKTGEGLFLDIALGVVGAVVGGYLVSLTGTEGVTGLNLWSLLVAVIGAIVVLLVYRMIVSRA